jgi:hypothetical protein
MDPITAIAAVSAALSLVESLIPKIAEWTKQGDISPEQQAELLAKYNSLRSRADGQFTGPEWEVRKD